MTTYNLVVDIACGTASPDNEAAFDEFTDRVMDALCHLEEVDHGITDADITASLANFALSISMRVAADSPSDAIRLFLANARTALHAAGGATPSWPAKTDWELPDPRLLDTPAA